MEVFHNEDDSYLRSVHSLVDKNAKDYLNSGTIKTFTFWDPADAGEAMCSLAEKVLKGEAIEDGVDLGVVRL